MIASLYRGRSMIIKIEFSGNVKRKRKQNDEGKEDYNARINEE